MKENKQKKSHKKNQEVKADEAVKSTKTTKSPKEVKPVKDVITVDGEVLEEEAPVVPVPQYVEMIDSEHLKIQDVDYTIVENYRDGFNAEALNGRYHDVLDKYDYIVGDWGFEQLRLKGFFRDDAKQVSHEKKIQFLQDYLYEFCNFGCAYFVIKRDVAVPIEERSVKNFEKRHNKKRPANKHKKVHNSEKKPKKRSEQFGTDNKKKKDSLPRNNKAKKPTRNFQIKEREQVQTPKSHKVPVKVPAKGPANKNRKKQFKIRETK